MDDLFNLENKIILVTGAGGFLGPWIVEVLARYGATVVALDILASEKTAGRIKEHLLMRNALELNERIICQKLDITSEKQVKLIVGKIISKFQKIDGLVNAAVYSKRTVSETGFSSYPLDEWKMGLDVSLTGTFILTKTIGKQMLKQKGDRSIVFFSSIYGYGTPHPEIYPAGTNKNPWYGTAKAGLLYLTTHLAREWGPKGIRVNAIVPGGVANNIPQANAFVKKYIKLTPLRGMANPSDLQGPLLLLMTAKYITGETLVVDGGFSIR